MNTAQFIPLSELDLSEDCKAAISNTDLTYGSAVHSLFTPGQILDALVGWVAEDKDFEILEDLQKQNEEKDKNNTPITYIDLET